MPAGDREGPMHIRLTVNRRGDLLRSLKDLFATGFDEPLSDFRAERIVEFFVRRLGPAVYNQAIQDARAFLAERLEDLDATFYEREPTE